MCCAKRGFRPSDLSLRSPRACSSTDTEEAFGKLNRLRLLGVKIVMDDFGTIATLGKSFGVTVTAEGVESEDQAAMLREFGCPQAQGFLFGQPGAPDATD